MEDPNFPGGDPQSGSTMEGPSGPPESKAEADPEAEDAGESALLPKSMFGDAKAGDTITVKVKHVYEEEVEVEPVGSGDKTKPEDDPGTPMDAAMGEMDRMGKAA